MWRAIRTLSTLMCIIKMMVVEPIKIHEQHSLMLVIYFVIGGKAVQSQGIDRVIRCEDGSIESGSFCMNMTESVKRLSQCEKQLV